MERRKFIVLLSLLLCAMGLKAQDVWICAGPALPVGQFKNSATNGFNCGVKLDWWMKENFCVVTSLDLFYNRMDRMMEQWEKSLGKESNFVATATPACINMPLMAHAKYNVKRKVNDENFEFWCEGAMGFNYRLVSQARYEYSGVNVYDKESSQEVAHHQVLCNFDPRLSMASQWGVGVNFLNCMSVGLVWYHLGRRSLTGNQTWTTTTSTSTNYVNDYSIDRGRMRTRMCVLRIGVML